MVQLLAQMRRKCIAFVPVKGENSKVLTFEIGPMPHRMANTHFRRQQTVLYFGNACRAGILKNGETRSVAALAVPSKLSTQALRSIFHARNGPRRMHRSRHHDRLVEEPFRHLRHHVTVHRNTASTLAEQSFMTNEKLINSRTRFKEATRTYVVRIAAKVGAILFYPLQGHALILQASISGHFELWIAQR